MAIVDIYGNLNHPLFVLFIGLTSILSISTIETEVLTARMERDTYDEREKLISSYKIVSKTQCLLQMRSFDGYVYAKHITNIYDRKETSDGKQ